MRVALLTSTSPCQSTAASQVRVRTCKMATGSAARSCEPLRGHAYGEDLRWQMIYQREMLGLTYQEVAKNLNADASTVWRLVKQFREHGSVAPKTHKGNSNTGDREQFVIIKSVLQNPAVYLQRQVEDLTGISVTESAICRFLQQSIYFTTEAY